MDKPYGQSVSAEHLDLAQKSPPLFCIKTPDTKTCIACLKCSVPSQACHRSQQDTNSLRCSDERYSEQ